MELVQNRIIFFLFKLFLISLALDLVTRVYFDEPIKTKKKLNTETSENVENLQTPSQAPESVNLNQENLNEDLDAVYLGSPNQVIKLDVFLCNSCGFKKHFDEIKLYLESRIPNLRVINNEYPIKNSKKMLSKLIMFLQYAIILFIFFGEKVFGYLKMPVPAIYYKMTQYKMFIVFGVYMFGNNLSSMLTSSGAFEVVFNNEVLFSKINQGGFPKPETLFLLLKNQFN